MKHALPTAALTLVLALALSGCTTARTDMNAKATTQPQPTQSGLQNKAAHDPSLIPSENGTKQLTTNRHGGVTNGMGTSVYSTIGSSGLHSNGFSAHLESRLSTLGVTDVRVFVFDDTVILATEKLESSAAHYDSMQQKLLSPAEDISGKKYAREHSMSSTGTAEHDNLSTAASKIKSILGAEVKVLTVTGAKAVKAIEDIRAEATSDHISPNKISDSFKTLMELVVQGRK